jgi:hypothetical protein
MSKMKRRDWLLSGTRVTVSGPEISEYLIGAAHGTAVIILHGKIRIASM